MSVLRSLENRIAGLVEGTFGRVFRSEVRPVEIARGLAKEMDQHKTVSVSRVYVPNEYVVWLSPDDRLKLGEFGIQARLVRAAAESDHAEQGDHGHTMVYSTSDRLREELDRPA